MMRSLDAKSIAGLEKSRESKARKVCRADRVDRGRPVFRSTAGWLVHVAAHGEFELDGVHALLGLAVVSRDVPAFETAIGDAA